MSLFWLPLTPGNEGAWSTWGSSGAELPDGVREVGRWALQHLTGERMRTRCNQKTILSWLALHSSGGWVKCIHPESYFWRTSGRKSGAPDLHKGKVGGLVGGGGPPVLCPWLENSLFPTGGMGTELSRLNWRQEEAILPLLHLPQEPMSLEWGLFAWCWCHQSLGPVGCCSPAARRVFLFPLLPCSWWGNKAFPRKRSLSCGVDTQQWDEDTKK